LKAPARKSEMSSPSCGTFMGIKGVQLGRVKFSFAQEVDTNQSKDDICQEIKIFTEDSGGGSYVLFSTKRWALDAEDIDKFAATLKKIVGIPEAL
jgi:hypothetical protein